ncbi:MAG: hypothetical protein D6819_02145 [Gammaproteobacteria bacterium]|nr:MAG: hypothetical protein D6819_02145 [Gammaproteobacteria bacterium]
MPETDKHVHAYQRMLERVKETLHHAEEGVEKNLHQAIEAAKLKAVELGELTEEEAERIGEFLLRDLSELAEYIAETEEDLAYWLDFELGLIVENVLPVIDETRLELERLRLEAQEVGRWYTGEITVGGLFRCTKCGEVLRLQGPVRIPPCPRCHHTVFKRIAPPPHEDIIGVPP